MKDNIYNVVVAVTEDEVVSCNCDCQAGSQGENRGLCVHILPVLLLFSIMLISDLAQNILVELCHRWDEHLEKKIESSLVTDTSESMRLNDFKKSILSIMEASGEDENELNRAKACDKVSEMLEVFSVGTEKAKVFLPRPNNDELLPLSEMCFDSNNKEIKKISSQVTVVMIRSTLLFFLILMMGYLSQTILLYQKQ